MNMIDSKRNKRMQKAVALQYVPQRDRAPTVTAKGAGFVAEKIIRLAAIPSSMRSAR